MSNIDISIIIPVFQVERYLEYCLDSVLSQSYEDYEIILIDDGSTDESGNICDKYASKDVRIRVIHQDNKGVSAARNAGLDIAIGKYILFLDSDDMLEKEALSKMIKAIPGYDIVIGNYVTFSNGHMDDISAFPEYADNKEISEIDFWKLSVDTLKPFNDIVWGRLYKRELFNGLRFKEGFLHEDTFINHEIISRTQKLFALNEITFIYRMNPDSITHNRTYKTNLDAAESFIERIKYFLEKKYNDVALVTLGLGLNFIFTAFVQNNKKKDERLNHIYKEYCDLSKRFQKYVNAKWKVKIFIFRLSLRLYAAVKEISK